MERSYLSRLATYAKNGPYQRIIPRPSNHRVDFVSTGPDHGVSPLFRSASVYGFGSQHPGDSLSQLKIHKSYSTIIPRDSTFTLSPAKKVGFLF